LAAVAGACWGIDHGHFNAAAAFSSILAPKPPSCSPSATGATLKKSI
jgi:hypothetical protein